PSFEAWKGGEARLNGLSEFINHVLCILPFEEEIRISHGVAATFLGHHVFEDILDLNMVNLANGGGVTVENELDLKEVISGPEPMEIDSKSSSSLIPNSGVAILQGHASKHMLMNIKNIRCAGFQKMISGIRKPIIDTYASYEVSAKHASTEATKCVYMS
ncbi:hypothetical protein Tco_1534969, partial [Tanacetum coccineum]